MIISNHGIRRLLKLTRKLKDLEVSEKTTFFIKGKKLLRGVFENLKYIFWFNVVLEVINSPVFDIFKHSYFYACAGDGSPISVHLSSFRGL